MATLVTIPDIGHGMVSATIIDWLVEEGSLIKAGDPILTIETEKTSTEVISPGSGFLRLIGFPIGSIVAPNQVVAVIGSLEENIDGLLEGEHQQARETSQPVEAIAAPTLEAAENIMAAPAAKRMAKEFSIDLALVRGSGPGGRIMMEDIQRAIDEKQTASQIEPLIREVIPMIGIRKTIAERLSLSKRTAADVTTVAEVHMDEVRSMREKVRASYTAYVIKAAAEALKAFPILNSSLEDDRILVKNNIDMSVAIATGRGLVVPVLRKADRLSLAEISDQIDQLSVRGRNDELTQEEFDGGTFTVTNSGAFGSLFFTPIINYPQSAVLGMGKVFETPVVRSNQVVVGWLMHLCLTYDHRVIDGEPAVKFLQFVKQYLENPGWMIENK